MPLRVNATSLHVVNTHLRMPFKYGIATAVAMPELFVSVTMDVDGTQSTGIASDCLPPKWFTKDPASRYRDDIADMLHVIEAACTYAGDVKGANTVFDLWQQVYTRQQAWAIGEGYPPLLYGFGLSLVERAMISAFCAAAGKPFGAAVRDGSLGIRLGEIHEELKDAAPADLLPVQPLRSIIARHTVGLGDPLTDADIADDARIDDGLPQSLEACIKRYGLTHFKIKLCGDSERDLPRLSQLAAVLEANCDGDYAFTLDGNENYRTVESFASLWQALVDSNELSMFMSKLIFVEQPLHRDVAVTPETADAMDGWDTAPPMIIDESDCRLTSLPEALEFGYRGTSVKNCKGIFKGIANGCLLEQLRHDDPQGSYLLSGEDLCNVGPVALLQDLASVSSLGIEHVERNGHHFIAGLSFLPSDMQSQMLAAHGDLYEKLDNGMVTLKIEGGRINIGSVVDAPYGVVFPFDPTVFTPLDDWTFDSLGIAED